MVNFKDLKIGTKVILSSNNSSYSFPKGTKGVITMKHSSYYNGLTDTNEIFGIHPVGRFGSSHWEIYQKDIVNDLIDVLKRIN